MPNCQPCRPHLPQKVCPSHAPLQLCRWNPNAPTSGNIYLPPPINGHPTFPHGCLLWPDKPVQQRLPQNFLQSHLSLRFLPRNVLPLITLLYGHAGTVHHKWADGTWRTLLMEEGPSQGCPLSPILSSSLLPTFSSHSTSNYVNKPSLAFKTVTQVMMVSEASPISLAMLTTSLPAYPSRT